MIDHFHTVSSPEITLIFCIVDKGQSFEQNIFTVVVFDTHRAVLLLIQPYDLTGVARVFILRYALNNVTLQTTAGFLAQETVAILVEFLRA